MPERIKYPVDPFFLSRYTTADRVAVMNGMMRHLIDHAAALVAASAKGEALLALQEAAKIETAIAECRRTDHCGASPV